MIRHQILLSLIIVTAWLPFNGVRAVEVLAAQELALHCKDLSVDRESADGQYCTRYIQGFIDGAVATDVRVMMNLEAELAHKETFSERAMRVRGPDLQRAAGYAEFCLGDPLPLLEVVEKVVADLTGRERIAPKLAAREFVYASLRKHYPCNKAAR